MSEFIIILLVIIGTIWAYTVAKWLYNRIHTPLLLPVAIATLFIITFLIIFQIPYGVYMLGGEWINKFLGPAVVALAYPLYENRNTLKKLVIPMVVGTLVGAIIGIMTGVGIAILIGYDDVVIYSIAPKSVTTPVAMDISTSLNGVAPLAAVFVMIAGISGAMVSSYIFNILKMKNPISRGIGLGSASHAIGTAKALENSTLEGSISTIAMILSAIFVSIITPFLITFLM